MADLAVAVAADGSAENRRVYLADARAGLVVLDATNPANPAPLGLAPTSSTTAALVMGDALAVALLETRGFTREDFARSHPAGRLGRRLLLHISDVMHAGDEIPAVPATATIAQAIVEMTEKRLGMTAVVDADGQVLGIYTDGDLRRTLDANLDPHQTPVSRVMSAGGKRIQPDALAEEGMHLMQKHRIQGLLVTDEADRLVGALNIHDLFREGLM